MKLYLSSYRIPRPEKLFELIGKKPEDMTGVIITNAKEQRTDEEKAQKLADLQRDLSKIGLKHTVGIDLRKDKVVLGDFDYIYAAGGNTFDLNRAILETNFEEQLREYLASGGVYVGESAGAIVAGPSLRGFEKMDEGRDDAVWDGMGLIEKIIVPHNDSPEPAYNDRAPDIQRANLGLDVIPLNDNADYIVND